METICFGNVTNNLAFLFHRHNSIWEFLTSKILFGDWVGGSLCDNYLKSAVMEIRNEAILSSAFVSNIGKMHQALDNAH